jgi:hypothetical protein
MPSKTQSILLGGLVIGLLSTSYLGFINIFCCAGIILGAMVSVWHYTNENMLTIQAGQGAAIGALAGIVGGLVALALDQVVGLVGLPSSQEMQQQIQQMFMPSNLDPEQMEEIQRQQEQFNSPMFKVIGSVIGMAVSAIFGAIGGAIGASVFKKGSPDQGMDIEA